MTTHRFMPPRTEDSDYTVTEFAAVKRLHPQTVRKMIKAGEIKSYRVGERGVRIPREERDWNIQAAKLA